MEEILNDDDGMKVEKSNVEQMEKHSNPKTHVQEPPPAGMYWFALNFHVVNQLTDWFFYFIQSSIQNPKLSHKLACSWKSNKWREISSNVCFMLSVLGGNVRLVSNKI